MPVPALRSRDLVVAASSDAYAVGSVGNAQLFQWRKDYPLESVAIADRLQSELLASYPHGLTAFHVVEQGAGIPPDDTRRAAQELVVRTKAATLCVAVVILGDGFFLSTPQSIAVGLFSIVGGIVTRSFGSVEQAADFMVLRDPKCPVTSAEIARAMNELRTRPSEEPR